MEFSANTLQYWTDDFDHDGTIDRAHFQQQLESLPGRIKSIDLAIFFEANLKVKSIIKQKILQLL